MGILYEKRFAESIQRNLPGAKHGQWFEYFADGQYGYCQPDVIVPFSNATLVLECKLKNVEQAQAQIIQLYRPILECCYSRPVRSIIVSRSLSALPVCTPVATTLLAAIQLTKEGKMPVLHWLGRGPL